MIAMLQRRRDARQTALATTAFACGDCGEQARRERGQSDRAWIEAVLTKTCAGCLQERARLVTPQGVLALTDAICHS